MSQLFQTTGVFKPDGLIAGNEMPLMAKGILIGKGYQLERGALLGKVDDVYHPTGTTLELTPTQEGGETKTVVVDASAILTDPIDTMESEGVATIFITGTFNREAILLEDGVNLQEYEDELQKYGIFLKTVQNY